MGRATGRVRAGSILIAGCVGLVAVLGQAASATDSPAAFRNAFRVRILVPDGRPVAVVVYLHGGGWVLGGIDQFDTLGRRLAVDAGAVVVLVDYRKAPEHPYPAAVDDAWRAVEWASDGWYDEAGRPLPLVVAGDSAGGNLAAVVAQRARAAGGPDLAGQVLVYPVTDCDLETDSYRDRRCQQLLTRDTMGWFWDHYAAPERRTEPEASPLRASDLTGLPPAAIALARFDPLYDEGRAYAERMRAAGVPVEVVVFDDQMHGFASLINQVPGADLARTWLADAVRGLTRP